VQRALDLALESFGTLAGAVVCHGVIDPPPSISGYGPGNALTSYGQMKFVSNINFLGVYNVAQKVSEILLKQEPLSEDGERGVIILISSIAGLDGSLVAYGSAKGWYCCVTTKAWA
jgi:3-hydroxyacyl-CoA dehydrogenase/3-hydroxy-2-methylbutyryl-CoA dehydrogenase